LSPGGKIDWAHHYGAADLALGETIAMADAVEIADKLTSDHYVTLRFEFRVVMFVIISV
jgi:alkaline phosphatase